MTSLRPLVHLPRVLLASVLLIQIAISGCVSERTTRTETARRPLPNRLKPELHAPPMPPIPPMPPEMRAEQPFPNHPDPNWLDHDRNRPLPSVITPAVVSTPERAGKAPSDAVVLFDGKDL